MTVPCSTVKTSVDATLFYGLCCFRVTIRLQIANRLIWLHYRIPVAHAVSFSDTDPLGSTRFRFLGGTPDCRPAAPCLLDVPRCPLGLRPGRHAGAGDHHRGVAYPGSPSWVSARAGGPPPPGSRSAHSAGAGLGRARSIRSPPFDVDVLRYESTVDLRQEVRAVAVEHGVAHSWMMMK